MKGMFKFSGSQILPVCVPPDSEEFKADEKTVSAIGFGDTEYSKEKMNISKYLLETQFQVFQNF